MCFELLGLRDTSLSVSRYLIYPHHIMPANPSFCVQCCVSIVSTCFLHRLRPLLLIPFSPYFNSRISRRSSTTFHNFICLSPSLPPLVLGTSSTDMLELITLHHHCFLRYSFVSLPRLIHSLHFFSPTDSTTTPLPTLSSRYHITLACLSQFSFFRHVISMYFSKISKP